MAFKSSLKLQSPIFDAAKRRAAGARAVQKTAQDFVRDLRREMENSPHTGNVVTKARGGSFSVRHQQSRRGQRPAPFTRTLLNSIKARRVSEVESVVEVGADFADALVKLGRVIVSRDDETKAQRSLNSNVARELAGLLK